MNLFHKHYPYITEVHDDAQYPGSECRTTQLGHEYIGTISVTRSGIPCQRWTTEEYQLHDFKDETTYPDESIEAASNYCRSVEAKFIL